MIGIEWISILSNWLCWNFISDRLPDWFFDLSWGTTNRLSNWLFDLPWRTSNRLSYWFPDRLFDTWPWYFLKRLISIIIDWFMNFFIHFIIYFFFFLLFLFGSFFKLDFLLEQALQFCFSWAYFLFLCFLFCLLNYFDFLFSFFHESRYQWILIFELHCALGEVINLLLFFFKSRLYMGKVCLKQVNFRLHWLFNFFSWFHPVIFSWSYFIHSHRRMVWLMSVLNTIGISCL